MRCRGLHRLANPAYLSRFPFSALPCVAPYCVPGGVRVVSIVRGSHAARSFTLDAKAGMGTCCPQASEELDGSRLYLLVLWRFYRHSRITSSTPEYAVDVQSHAAPS